MAFAGHARSLDLSCTPSGHAHIATIANMHPDRHRHILSEQTPPKSASHVPPNRTRSHSSQLESNKDLVGRSQRDDIMPPPNKVSFHEAVLLGTDDVLNSPTKSLWIGNVPTDLKDADLHGAFEQYGPILSVRATTSKRCGFVNFEMIESAMEAWRECHERDIFNTGVAIYVRYEKPPSWLRDKRPSLKRKRSLATPLASPAEDSVRRPIPTGPRSQVQHSTPPTGPKSQQTSISPPPPRRHDIYRPQSPSAEDLCSRKAGERYRQVDLYRPLHDNVVETVQIDKRSVTTARTQLFPRDHARAKGSPVGNPFSSHANQARSPSPSTSSLHSTNLENAIPSFGIGIKGLAASRKEYFSEDRRAGLSIKGAAAQNRAPVFTVSANLVPRNVISSRGSFSSEKASCSADHSGKIPRSPSPGQTQDDPGSSKTYADEKLRVQTNDASLINSTSLCDSPAIVKEKINKKSLSNGLPHAEAQTVQDKTPSLRKSKHGFPYLTHLIAVEDRGNTALQKARTVSPLSRRRASSRATTSVESAKTDPTPIHKRTPDTCVICGMGGSLYKLFKCAVPSCFKRVHEMCSNFVSNDDSASSSQKIKAICDTCPQIDQDASKKMSLGDSIAAPDAGLQQDIVPDDGEEVTSLQESKNVRCNHREVTYSFVSIGSATTTSDRGSEGKVAMQGAQTHLSKQRPQVVVQIPESRFGSEKKAASRKLSTQTKDGEKTISNPPTQPKSLPPTEPRLMREGDVDERSLEVSIRYKNTVTCPWWKKGGNCVRHPNDCMFAHHLTGIESPNGRSVAKDWTCFDYFRTSLGCRRLEKDCLYSHKDTGLYVGLDGKASKKHLECYWWRQNGRCTFSDASCTCAHYFTGLVAEEPMPRDTVRRAPQQTSTVPSQENDASSDLQPKSPSYSPPPPLTATSDSVFVAQWPLQLHSGEANNPLLGQIDDVTPKLSTYRKAEAGVDPRLKRNMDSGLRPEQPNTHTQGHPSQTASSNHVHQSGFDGANSPLAESGIAPQQSKQRAMNACKNCSKLVFKAEICIDCIKLSQQRDTDQASIVEHATDQSKLDGSSQDPTSKTAAAFATPAPRVLKRSRTGSNSNIFPSKRMRPDMTASRSSFQPSATNNSAKLKSPPTLEQLNRANAKKRAKEDAQARNDLNHPNMEKSARTEHAETPLAPTFSPFTLLDSPEETSQSPVLDSHIHASKRQKTVYQGQNDTVDVLREAYGESEDVQSRSESPTSRCNSETPLAELRSRGDNLLWSPSTSNTSPKASRNASKVTTSGVAAALNGRRIRAGPQAPRCATCIKYHRRCVHDSTSGELDDRKCYNWQEDRIRFNIIHNAHYPEAEREQIYKRARRYLAAQNQLAVAQHDAREASEDESDDTESAQSDEEDLDSSSSDEIQKPHSKSSVSTWQVPIPESPKDRSLLKTPVDRPSVSQMSFSDGKKAGDHAQNEASLEKQKRTEIIGRLMARGAVFEEDDDTDDEYEVQANVDNRIDPLLYHKQKNADQVPALKLPSITKGQGLKNPHLIYRRQMTRNFQMFGDRHKEVDRKIPHQEVLAMVEKKNPDDVSARPNEFEDKMTFREFLGLQKDKQIESCLGKITLPRGKFTMGLAFREKEIDPGLGAWGRERRGNKKEKPVYVVGL